MQHRRVNMNNRWEVYSTLTNKCYNGIELKTLSAKDIEDMVNTTDIKELKEGIIEYLISNNG